MSILQSAQFGLCVGKQAAKGTPAVSANRRLRQVSGGLIAEKSYGRSPWGDGKRFSTAVDYTERIEGKGDIVVQGTPTDVAYLAWLALGTDTYTAADDDEPTTHVITPREDGPRWFSAWNMVGENPGIKHRYNDCMIGSLAIETSSSSPSATVAFSLVSLDPAIQLSSFPSTAATDADPLLHHEAEGTFLLRGTAIPVSQFRVSINNEVSAHYADSVRPRDVVLGRSSVELALTVALDTDTLPLWNELLYGTQSPAADAKPSADVLNDASFEVTLSRGADDELEGFKIEIPAAAMITGTPAIEGNEGGGVVEIALAGEGRDNGTDPMITITCWSQDAQDAAAF